MTFIQSYSCQKLAIDVHPSTPVAHARMHTRLDILKNSPDVCLCVT